MLTLRPYQADAFCNAFKLFDSGCPSCLIVHPTGTGKTVVFGAIAKCEIEDYGGRVLVLAHRDELIQQSIESMIEFGLVPSIEKAGEHAMPRFTRPAPGDGTGTLFGDVDEGEDPRVVAASVQTLQGKRLKSWPPGWFSMVICDECFPAGTPIDGRPIESIEVGDLVESFNESTWLPEPRRVSRVFRRRPSGLVCVHLSDGRSIVCTPDHPIFTFNHEMEPCYVDAKDLTPYNLVYGITSPLGGFSDGDQAENMRCVRDRLLSTELEQHDDAGVFGSMQGEAASGAGQDGVAPLCLVREGRGVSGADRTGTSQEGQGVLLGRLPRPDDGQDGVGEDGRNEPQACFGSDASEEPDVRPGLEGEDAKDARGDWTQAIGSGRERDWSDWATIGVGLCSRVADGTCRPDLRGTGSPGWTANALQDRCCRAVADGGDRSGRVVTFGREAKGPGSAKGNLSPVARVDRVEVLEPGSDGRFEGMCPDGFVYNLEVEGNHNYFANGLLVHNCHHATADSYRAVIDHFKPKKYLGVTATPDRTDGTPIVGPNQIFHALAHEYTITEAVESVPPALTRPFFEVVDCGADISKVRRRQGDLSPEDLAKAIGPHVAKMANEVVHYVRDRAGSILFAPTVSIADAFASAFQSLGIPAISACGKDGDRAEITAGVRAGKWKVACNCALWTEGANFPYIDTVINARPTESRSLFVQMAGRMMRLYPGKTDCLMVGFDWGMTSHKLVHPVELFGGPGLGDLDMAWARKLMDSGKERDVLKAVRRAAKENRERERIKVKAKAETKTARTFRFDPLSVDGGSLAEPVWDKSSDAFARKASDKQIQMLERFKFKADEVVNWTHSRASATISAMIKRREAGLASKPQVDLLNKFRVPNAANLGFGQASDLITKIKGNGWRFVPSMLVDVPRHEPRRAERDEFVPY